MKNPMPGWLVAACLAAFLLPPLHGASTAVVVADGVNLRARPDAHSEIIGQLAKGRRLTVLEDVPGPRASGVTGLWSRVALPSDTPVWVFADFINPENHRVVATMLNVRAGPGEEHASLGVLLKGERVEVSERKGNWLKIKAPIGTYGFVAAEYLKTIRLIGASKPETETPPPSPEAPASEPAKEVAPPAPTAEAAPESGPQPPAPDTATPAPAPAEPADSEAAATAVSSVASPSVPPAAPEPETAAAETAPPTPVRVTTVSPAPAPAAPATPSAGESQVRQSAPPAPEVASLPEGALSVPVVAAAAPESSAESPAPGTARAVSPAAAPPKAVSPLPGGLQPRRPGRVVVREGIVRRALSIQAPGGYELRQLRTGDRLVYLHPARPDLRLKPFVGKRVLVRGAEYIDVRWPATPVLLVEHITLAP
ncbi:MAG: SH3 domain-containing protein [Verrucomicrobia bacterium]|nr:MAG: SH3 domain-containing protein [Verrucomicrobiota bacterium]